LVIFGKLLYKMPPRVAHGYLNNC